ncbi:MAG: hypothetical protein LBW77_00060, partial [Verrucomicrobiota bacterium]|nr:hypothetical protein [Verrucomicrobiota bacterium]
MDDHHKIRYDGSVMPSLPNLFDALLEGALPREAGRLAAPALPGASAALTAAALARRSPARLALAVTPGPAELERVYGDLCALGRDSGVTPGLFPPAAGGDPETAGVRLRVIRDLRLRAPSQPPAPGLHPSIAD